MVVLLEPFSQFPYMVAFAMVCYLQEVEIELFYLIGIHLWFCLEIEWKLVDC